MKKKLKNFFKLFSCTIYYDVFGTIPTFKNVTDLKKERTDKFNSYTYSIFSTTYRVCL
jgi:hypothetical protein